VASSFPFPVRRVAVVLGLAIAVGVPAVLLYERSLGPQEHGPVKPATAPLKSEPPIGAIDMPAGEALFSRTLELSGWALDRKGIREVAARLPDQTLPATYGLPRPDVASVKAEYPRAGSSGFTLHRTFDAAPPLRVPIDVVATNVDGVSAVLGRRSLVPTEALQLWSAWSVPAGSIPFHFLMATSGVAKGGAAEVDTLYRGYASATQRIGVAVPVLYLRTTRGRAADWTFDPDFDTARKCGDRPVADDALNGVLRYAADGQLPLHLILNGGIWADATCNTPEWDLNDHLEQDPRNCQWTQDDKVPPDDFLKNLAGSTTSPELARSLTLNVYARSVRHYKKRNLQAAARRIAEFARAHPALFVGVNLDSDTYLNPFFEQREWFDYHPDTLRQFREWLQADGPYAGRGPPGVPDLRAYRRGKPLSLADVNRLANAQWKRWQDVQPPRRFPGSQHQAAASGQSPVWDDPWYREWDTFRKHLVALHYDELAQWTHEAGIPKDRIFTAQGFVAPEGDAKPFAVRITSAGQNYDSGGVSIEGSIPRAGHLGAILYGPAAENRVRMEHRHGLFATFARMDPGWAVVESNLADLKRPGEYPSYAQAYRAFRDLFNYDARQVSLMAWNGSNGIFAGQPGYVSYTSWRNTPAEEAMRDHLVSHAGLPLGSRLWTFGSAQHADDDGWTVQGGSLRTQPARLVVTPVSDQVSLSSAADQVIRRRNASALVIGIDPGAVRRIEVLGEAAPGSGWLSLGTFDASSWKTHAAGVEMGLRWPRDWGDNAIAEQIRLVIIPAKAGLALNVDRLALIGTIDR
jgi:hypothetical protein